MGVFPGFDANVPTQLWIAARYFQSLALLAAPGLADRQASPARVIAGCGMISALLAASVFAGVFPDCFVEGKGLTPFKIYSEYAIALIFTGSIVLLRAGRIRLDPDVRSRLLASIGVMVLAELSFTLYGRDVYGFFNLLGHFFKVVSFYLLYRAVIATDLLQKLERLVRDLGRSEAEARVSRDRLEERVAARTAELRDANALLAVELAERQRAQEEARHLASFPETNPNPVLEVDLSGAVIYANPVARRIAEDRGEGEGLSSLLPEDLDVLLQDREKAAESALYREVRVGGRVFAETVHFLPRLGVVRIYAGDITERTRAEEEVLAAKAGLETRVAERTSELRTATEQLRDALRERRISEERLRRIFEVTPIGVTITDMDGRFVELNPAYEKMLGYAAADLIGKTVSCVNLPDDVPRSTDLFRDLVSGKRNFYDREKRIVRKDGSVIWVRLRTSLLRGDDGSPEYAYTMVEDTTSAKQAGESLRASEERFRALVERLPVGICIVQDGRILFRNPQLETLFGPVREGQEFRGWMDIHPEDAVPFGGLCEALDSGALRPTETDLRFYPSGKAAEGVGARWVHLRATPIDHRGKTAALLSLIDVTRARELEHLVRVREKMSALGHVATGIAHEIRNPLSGINIYLSNLDHLFGQAAGLESAEREKITHIVGKLRSASERIASVIHKVMEFSKPAPPRMNRVNLNAAVEEALRLSVPEIRKRDVRLETCLAPDLPPCAADLRLIEQVVLNLINNASQAMEGDRGPAAARSRLLPGPRPRGRAHLRFRARDPPRVAEQDLRPVLHDTEGGVRHRPELQPPHRRRPRRAAVRRDEPLGRRGVPHGDSVRSGGSRLHDGVARGSQVEESFPHLRISPPPRPNPRAHPAGFPPNMASPLHFHAQAPPPPGWVRPLQFRGMIAAGRRVFRGGGWNCTSFSGTGKSFWWRTIPGSGIPSCGSCGTRDAAWSWLGGVPSGRIGSETDRFDVVICDHRPPRLDGVAYLALARSALPDAILILLTGDRAEAVRPEAERAGVDEVIGKPFTVETMERSIERALRRLDGAGRRTPPSA